MKGIVILLSLILALPSQLFGQDDSYLVIGTFVHVHLRDPATRTTIVYTGEIVALSDEKLVLRVDSKKLSLLRGLIEDVEPAEHIQQVDIIKPSENHNLWFGWGLGYSSLGGLAGSANVSFRYNFLIGSLRTTANMGDTDGFLGPSDEFFDRALIVGFCAKKPKTITSIGVGVAQVFGRRYDPDTDSGGWFVPGTYEEFHPLWGISIEGQLVRTSKEKAGAGLYGYVNLNQEEVFGGITITLLLGKLR